jgi:hypothetical protein
MNAMVIHLSRPRQKKPGESDNKNIFALLGEKMVEVDYLKKKSNCSGAHSGGTQQRDLHN